MAAAEPGPWRDVDNQDEIFDEVCAYDEARRLLKLYTQLLQQVLTRRAVPDAVAAVAAVKRTIDGLPMIVNLMHGSYKHGRPTIFLMHGLHKPGRPVANPWVWQFHRAYFEFSANDKHSRSWLLFTLAGLVQELERARASVAQSERTPASEQMYDKATAAYEKWRALAEPRLSVPLSALRARELGGKTRRTSKLPHLLQRLAACGI
jgi:hypothetical protein